MAEPEVKPQKLAEKLAEACANVGGVEKKGRNESQRYDYVKAADVAKAIRHELFKRGVVIIPDEIECSTKQIQFHNAKGEARNANEVVVRTAYNITDGIQTIVMHGYGIAWDAGDKAIYKAKTGSLKYFLRGLGLIPDEKDDPEGDESIDKAAAEIERGKMVNQRLATYQEDFDERTESQRPIGLSIATAFVEFAVSKGVAQTALLAQTKGVPLQDLTRPELEELKAWVLAHRERGITRVEMPQVASAGSGTPKGSSDAKLVTKPQLIRLFAICKEKNVDVKEVDQRILDEYGLAHKHEMTRDQYNQICQWVEMQ